MPSAMYALPDYSMTMHGSCLRAGLHRSGETSIDILMSSISEYDWAKSTGLVISTCTFDRQVTRRAPWEWGCMFIRAAVRRQSLGKSPGLARNCVEILRSLA